MTHTWDRCCEDFELSHAHICYIAPWTCAPKTEIPQQFQLKSSHGDMTLEQHVRPYLLTTRSCDRHVHSLPLSTEPSGPCPRSTQTAASGRLARALCMPPPSSSRPPADSQMCKPHLLSTKLQGLQSDCPRPGWPEQRLTSACRRVGTFLQRHTSAVMACRCTNYIARCSRYCRGAHPVSNKAFVPAGSKA